MRIAGYDIQPIVLHLPDDIKYVKQSEDMKNRLHEAGINDAMFVSGIHADKFGILGIHPYTLDNPDATHYIGQKYVGSFLSQYVVYNVMKALPNEYFLFFEPDAVLPDNFLRKLEFEMFNLPPDFDFLFIESCCAMDKPMEHVGGNVYKFKKNRGYPSKYPCGGACFIISKKCLEHVIATQRDTYAPADLSLGMHSFYAMDVYAILPRLVQQKGNENLPH